ncbi:ribose-phosphate pyrophosphokinase [Sphingomonas sp. ID0503]|uniref:ribose-phosphate pyrophosphokinase n=1 Tax=Sphingomonas sp. ID0503 TaxID=3399691 RepID=UPI003AFAFEA3
MDKTLAEWLDDAPADAAARIGDVAHVRALLIAAARAGETVSYSGLLGQIGLRFTRPKMRQLMKTLDRIDAEGRAAGEPELAVLVVRESDRLPGQGWWAGGHAEALGHKGPWEGPQAAALVRRVQQAAFDYWRGR